MQSNQVSPKVLLAWRLIKIIKALEREDIIPQAIDGLLMQLLRQSLAEVDDEKAKRILKILDNDFCE